MDKQICSCCRESLPVQTAFYSYSSRCKVCTRNAVNSSRNKKRLSGEKEPGTSRKPLIDLNQNLLEHVVSNRSTEPKIPLLGAFDVAKQVEAKDWRIRISRTYYDPRFIVAEVYFSNELEKAYQGTAEMILKPLSRFLAKNNLKVEL